MQKKALRSLYLAKRMELCSSEKFSMEEKIVEHLFSHFSFSGKVTSCFLPIASKFEIDTWKIITGILQHKGDVALPVWDSVSNQLVHRMYSDDVTIVENTYGIPEPQEGDVCVPDVFDFVLIPLLVVDKKGARVGYGKGVYDRFLAGCSPKTIFIGLSFFELIDSISDTDGHDIPLHYCVTPTKCYGFEK